MRHQDIFSGIGGFALAASWVWGKEHEIISFVEIDKYCQKVLKKHWPSTPIIEDVCNVKGNVGTVDLLTGGYPCQPFSLAGKQRGEEDDRYLWPEMFRIIKEQRPRWIIGENVAGHVNMGLDTVLSNLEAEGYSCQAFIIPACAVDARHRRDRVWIVANTINCEYRTNGGQERKEDSIQGKCGEEGHARGIGRTSKNPEVLADTDYERCQQCRPETRPRKKDTKGMRSRYKSFSTRSQQNWPAEPAVGRVANGVPNRVDRLKALGNAIVPQVVAVIMQAIKDIDADK